MEWEGEICFMGYGTIESVKENQFANYNPARKKYLTKIKDFTAFEPPRRKDDQLREMLLSIPDYNWTDDIRPITKEVFDIIIRKCAEPDPKSRRRLPVPIALDSVDVILSKQESVVLEFKGTMMTPIIPSRKIQNLEDQMTKSTTKADSVKLRNEIQTIRNELVKDLELEIIGAVAAFLNGNGGTLVVGVIKGKDNSNDICGIEPDYKSLKDWDGWYLHFTDLVKKYMDDVTLIPRNINVRYDKKDNKTLARITVTPRGKATWIPVGPRKDERLPVRTGPRTELLSGKQAVDYIIRHGLQI